jgi:uncharacterized OB-fold protein
VPPKTPSKKKEEPEEPDVTCPVCGNVVTLDDPFCPHCGAEFEEEEVEEIVEVDEVVEVEDVPEAPEDEAKAEAAEVEEEPVEVEAEEPVEAEADEEAEEEDEEAEDEEEAPSCPAPGEAAPLNFRAHLLDMRVFGITLLLLGILGAQIAFFVTWYWKWVPPITSNLTMYMIIGIIIIVVGLLSFKLASDRANAGKKMHPIMPSVVIAIFLFGIIATIMLVAGGTISNAMTGSGGQIGMGTVFIVLIVIGILLFMMGAKKASGEKKAASA